MAKDGTAGSATTIAGDGNESPPGPSSRPGRKRDGARDGVILESTLAVLAERGYEGMTIDLVAAHAGMARATVYRRWPTKADLVLAAVGRLADDDAPEDGLPDTGELRSDLAAMVLDLDDEGQQVRIRALAGLVSLASADGRLAGAATSAGIGPWTAAIATLMERAVDRGEYPPCDIDTLASVIPLLCISRAVQRLPLTRSWSLTMIDHVLLPAMRGSRTT